MKVDIFPDGFSLEIDSDIAPSDEESFYKYLAPLVARYLRENNGSLGFDWEIYNEEDLSV